MWLVFRDTSEEERERKEYCAVRSENPAFAKKPREGQGTLKFIGVVAFD